MRVRSFLVAGVSAATLAIGLTGCPGVVPGADPSSNTSPAPTSNTDNGSVHQGTISSNETWTKAKSPHIVKDDVYVESANGATLTIEPGAEVRFEHGAGLYFGWNGGTGILKAEGTSTESITFTSTSATKAKGDWDQIYIGNGGASSVMSYAKVMYGGGDGSEGTSVLRVTGNANKPTIRNCTFEENNGTAITAEDNSSFTAFENNTIKGSQNSPLHLDANAAGSLGVGNTFVSNGIQAIEVTGSTVTKNVEWRNFGVPYLILDDVYVQGTNTPTLTLDAGNTLRFTKGHGLYVCWNGGSGALYAVGTSTDKITLTGVESDKNPGAWSELYFGAGAVAGASDNAHSCYLKNVVLQYGGGNGGESNASIRINDAKPLFDTVTVKDTLGHGVYVEGSLGSTIPLTEAGLGSLTFEGSVEVLPNIRYPQS